MRLAKLFFAMTLCCSLLAPSTVFAGPGGPVGEGLGVYFEPAGSFFFRNFPTTGSPDAEAFLTTSAGFIQLSGDWNGSGKDGIGIYDTSTGTFWLADTVVDSPSAPLAADYSFFMATDGANWLPIAGDWDGDGSDGVGIYNITSGSMFLIDVATTTGGVFAAADYSLYMTTNGANFRPIAGNWTGTGTNDGVGLYDTTTGSMFLANDATVGGATAADLSIFLTTDGASFLPVAGDWNQNGSDGVGIFSTTSGTFFLANDATQGSSAAAPADLSAFINGSATPLGGAGYVPLTGFWDTAP